MNTSKSIVLAGDSIFDNAAYVIGQPCLSEQLRELMGEEGQVVLCAVDGHCVIEVPAQLARLPDATTHIFVSAGGNDALSHYQMLMGGYLPSPELLQRLTAIQSEFRREYHNMLQAVTGLSRYVAVCTIYDAVPEIEAEALTALSLFNDVIVSEGVALGLPIVDLRQICTEHADFAASSPIEPSWRGAAKIAAALKRVVDEHDYGKRQTAIYI